MATAKKADLKIKSTNFTGDDGKLIYLRAHYDHMDGKPTSYPPTSHDHEIEEVIGLQAALDGKAPSGHTHDDRYYTETESDARFRRYRYARIVTNTTTMYWGKVAEVVMPVTYNDKNITFLVTHGYNSTNKNKVGILRLSIRCDNNTSIGAENVKLQWILKQSDINENNFVAITDGVSTVSLYVKTIVQYGGIYLTVLEEDETSYSLRSYFSLYEVTAPSISDLSTVGGTQIVSTVEKIDIDHIPLDSSNRFVTDAEKANWNSKFDTPSGTVFQYIRGNGSLANFDHNHDNRYYTESESDGRFLIKKIVALPSTQSDKNDHWIKVLTFSMTGNYQRVDYRIRIYNNENGYSNSLFGELHLNGRVLNPYGTTNFEGTLLWSSLNDITKISNAKVLEDADSTTSIRKFTLWIKPQRAWVSLNLEIIEGSNTASTQYHTGQTYPSAWISEANLSTYGTVKYTAAQFPQHPDYLIQDSTHRLVTDAEKATWNGKQNALTTINQIPRFNHQGNATSTNYHKLAIFPIDNTGNYSSVIIRGRLGGWTNDNMAYFEMILTNRSGAVDGNTIGASIYGIGKIGNAQPLASIVVYKQDNKSAIAYLKLNGYYAYDIEVETYQATLDYSSTNVTPTGTLIWESVNEKTVTVQDGALRVYGSNDDKINLYGSSNPYIRFHEGTTQRAYIQYASSLNRFRLENQEAQTVLDIGTDLIFKKDGVEKNVILGDDPRLTDARTPVSHYHTTDDISHDGQNLYDTISDINYYKQDKAPTNGKKYLLKDGGLVEFVGGSGNYSETTITTLTNNSNINLSSFSGYNRIRLELYVYSNDNSSSTPYKYKVEEFYPSNFVRKSYTGAKQWSIAMSGGTYVLDLIDAAIASPTNFRSYLNANYPATGYNVGDKARGTDGTLPIIYYYAEVTSSTSYKDAQIDFHDNGKFATISATQAKFTAPTTSGVTYRLKIIGINF